MLEPLGQTASWSISRHKYLFQSFCLIFVLADGRVVEEHPDFMHASCSKHVWFIKGIIGQTDSSRVKQGPQSHKRKKARPQRSERFREKVRTPSPRREAAPEDAAVVASAAAVEIALVSPSLPVQPSLWEGRLRKRKSATDC